MTQMPKLLVIIGVVAAAILVAGCTSVDQTPSTTATVTGTPAATGTETETGTPAATGIETPAGTSTTTEIVTVTDTPSESGTGSSTDSSTVLNEEMNESTVVVKLNSRFALELAENPSTGYTWNLTTTDGLRILSDEYVTPGTATNVVGAEGTHRWELEAITEGLQEIDGVYRRSWENTTADENTFVVEISVEP